MPGGHRFVLPAFIRVGLALTADRAVLGDGGPLLVPPSSLSALMVMSKVDVTGILRPRRMRSTEALWALAGLMVAKGCAKERPVGNRHILALVAVAPEAKTLTQATAHQREPGLCTDVHRRSGA